MGKDASSRRPIFVFGVNSMLGWSIAAQLTGHDVRLFCNRFTRVPAGARWIPLDFRERDALRVMIRRERPALVIHSAGICNVEKCERSPAFAREVNVAGMHHLLACTPTETRVVYVSSDHVFSGDTGPYTESSATDPISVHGRTRVAAERALLADREHALVVRAGLWIGPSYNGRTGHLDWLRYRTARGLPMTVIEDEYRSAVWSEQAGVRVRDLALSTICGVRHVVAQRIVSRPALARYLTHRFDIGACIAVKTRDDRPVPHLGRLDLRTEHDGALAEPLAPVVPATAKQASSRRL